MSPRFELEYVGPDNLPPGWHRPTVKLVEAIKRNTRAGLALPSASHLYIEASPVQGDLVGMARHNVAVLEAYVDPESSSELKAAGMAYPQLAVARKGSLRVFVAANMATLHPSDRRKGVVFINPVITPLVEEGTSDDIEMCFSGPALAMLVTRFNVIEIASDNHPITRLEGSAARIAQHENDHLNGIVCVDLGMEQQPDRVIYYVPPELHRIFFDEYHSQGRLSEWPFIFSVEQWLAMKSGRYVILGS